MARSHMQSAVIQYTILVALDMILSHEIGRNAYDSVWEDPVLKNFTNTMKTYNPSVNVTNLGNITNFNNITSLGNITISNISISAVNTTTDPLSFLGDSEDFYSKNLPIGVFVLALLSPLMYYWHIYLERFFPTRPRGVEVDYSKQKEKTNLVDMNEIEEEEVVKRWIAQGKVRRSSISWWNTFVKWVLNVTVGKVLFTALQFFGNGLMRWHSVAKILENFKMALVIRVFSQFLTIGPFGALIGFIVVPATKRLAFGAAINTVQSVFISSFFRLVVPWLVGTEMVQTILSDTTKSLLEPQGGVGGINPRLIGGPDEL